MQGLKFCGVAALLILLVFVAYFGAYFLTADYVDIGDNMPHYLVRYRLGSLSLDSLSSCFEPARQFDESYLSQRQGSVLTWAMQ